MLRILVEEWLRIRVPQADMRTRRLFEGLIRFGGAILLLVGIGQFIVPKQYSLSNLPRPGNPSPEAAEPTQHHNR
jgi:hypothetical protein